jgi:hypothetical protein
MRCHVGLKPSHSIIVSVSKAILVSRLRSKMIRPSPMMFARKRGPALVRRESADGD